MRLLVVDPGAKRFARGRKQELLGQSGDVMQELWISEDRPLSVGKLSAG